MRDKNAIMNVTSEGKVVFKACVFLNAIIKVGNAFLSQSQFDFELEIEQICLRLLGWPYKPCSSSSKRYAT